VQDKNKKAIGRKPAWVLDPIPGNPETASGKSGNCEITMWIISPVECGNINHKDRNMIPDFETITPPETGKKIRTSRTKHQTNPFLRDVVATLGDKRVAVSMKTNMVEIDHETGEMTHIPGQITKMISADRESFVKLYTAQIDAFFELSKAGRAVIKYLIWLHQQDANKHLFYLHPDQVREAGMEIGKTAWYDGIGDLIGKKIVAASTLPHMFFLNPAVFFNGDRTRLVIEVKKIRKREDVQIELEARGQQRLVD
jgi:hypothetical protein